MCQFAPESALALTEGAGSITSEAAVWGAKDLPSRRTGPGSSIRDRDEWLIRERYEKWNESDFADTDFSAQLQQAREQQKKAEQQQAAAEASTAPMSQPKPKSATSQASALASPQK